MATFVAFDTLAFANRLKAAGVSPELAEAQASAQAELMSNLIDDHLATKEAIKKLELTTKQDIEDLRGEVRYELKDFEHRLLVKLGSIMIGGTAIIVSLITILHLN